MNFKTNWQATTAGVGVGFLWMLFIDDRSETPVSVWSPGIDIPSFLFSGLLILWGCGRLASFIGGAIFGVHAAQLFFHLRKNET